MKGLLILGGLFFVMYFFVVLATIVSGKIFPTGTRNFYLLSSAVQSILLFGVPALLMYVMTSHSVWKSRLCLSKKASIADYFRAIIIFLVFIPGMDYVAKLNQQVHFPIAEMEQTFRNWENSAQEMTQILLNTDSFGGMLLGVIVIGIITGLCEELFFRGALQGLFVRSGMNKHIAVWSAATIFSLAHFQFYGFVPRLLLGVILGYLLVWSGSIWVPALIHAINNSAVVVIAYIENCYPAVKNAENLDNESWFVWVAILSIALTVWLMVRFHKSIMPHHQ